MAAPRIEVHRRSNGHEQHSQGKRDNLQRTFGLVITWSQPLQQAPYGHQIGDQAGKQRYILTGINPKHRYASRVRKSLRLLESYHGSVSLASSLLDQDKLAHLQ